MAPRLHQALLSWGTSNDSYQLRATRRSCPGSQALGMVCHVNVASCSLSQPSQVSAFIPPQIFSED